jgi:three-Cys-motif partner protein
VKEFEYDEIGYWSEIKLDIVRKYAGAYTKILSTKPTIKKYIYIDAFAGAGKHISRKTGEFIKGSPLNALEVNPPFSEIHLIDLNGGKAEELRKQVGSQQDVFIYENDANKVLLDTVFPRCKYGDYHRALCLLDPYALKVDWNILKTAGQMGSIEVFYNFMIMDANMNVLWRNPDKVSEAQVERMDRVWGDRSWQKAAYHPRLHMFDGIIDEKGDNEDVAEAFRQRLKEVAGFKYVPKPMPMRNEKGAVIYYLFFASPNNTGATIVEDIFNNYRTKGVA